jgi:hypothetical protein
MEAGYSPLEERKEGGDGAFLPLHQLTEAATADFTMEIDHGQPYFAM